MSTCQCIPYSVFAHRVQELLGGGYENEKGIMKKKGKSNEEKKFILYDIMLESESFFVLKELETLAPKRGIRSIFVKDLLQQLVDDNKVKSEKVGAQNVFWVLKTEESSSLQNKYQEMQVKKTEYEELTRKEKDEYEELVKSLNISEDELRTKVDEAKALVDKLEQKKKELQKLKKTDIKEIERMQKQNEFAIESIERWNNNISILRQWIQDRTDKPWDIVDRLMGV
ncbi:meiotic nuclear division protein 1, putative [Plasmodium ovale wallikeri]|uniref:Meiotic nuclear division protein 1, putative n=1 Tax=Plasmodium ovale wallikeri TaxID=864142 RepID=A0A1A8ZFT8_PLAOA|nr:meiotic nuclear division protein 1, putative [Plasmodium ovale wallikeri]SBT42674.1 meiotic nuclear division protein 1, putative [Plasmodium ovale wallikeri]